MKKIRLFFLTILSVSFLACQQAPKEETKNNATSGTENLAKPAVFKNDPVKLGDYWYQGKAEVNHYTLQQNRYRDLHPGEAVLIFVTEDFLTDKQVKNDNYKNPNSTPILKTNYLRRFPTGVYDYSIMTSVFTPVKTNEFPHTLKVTTSSQDWCGHTFMQINHKENTYRMELRSYFEDEGDQTSTVPDVILEDELFNRIRMNPESLPTGKVKILPGTAFSRLKHENFKPQEASITLENYSGEEFEGEKLKAYRVEYPTFNRTLEIVFENKAPYRIQGWTDASPSVFDGKIRKSIAKKTETLVIPYWEKNALEDMSLRKDLGLMIQ